MDKENVVYMYNGILLSYKKEGSPAVVTTGVDLEGIVLRKISQTENDNYHMISLICGS